MRTLVTVTLVAVVGCSSKESTTSGPAPVSVPEPAAHDFTLQVVGNSDAERLVMGGFSSAPPSRTCTTEDVAGCRLSTCTNNEPAPGAAIDPGEIKASSASIGNDVVVPFMSGYARLVQPGLFPDGEEVHLVGVGSMDVAPFDLRVKLPNGARARSFGNCAFGTAAGAPACELKDAAPTVTWDGGSDFVTASLQAGADAPLVLSCSFSGAAGSGQIPASALARLPRDRPYDIRLGTSTAMVVGAPNGGRKIVGAYALRLLKGATTSVRLAF